MNDRRTITGPYGTEIDIAALEASMDELIVGLLRGTSEIEQAPVESVYQQIHELCSGKNAFAVITAVLMYSTLALQQLGSGLDRVHDAREKAARGACN